jgi:hypothetical protein
LTQYRRAIRTRLCRLKEQHDDVPACRIRAHRSFSRRAPRPTRSGYSVPTWSDRARRILLLGVALSGGGSRAALFGAAGLEALANLRTADGVSLIDKISHLSSVSGGSLAAAYYALKKPNRDVNVLDANGALSGAYRAFFDKYRAELSQDFETSLIWRQLLSFRSINSGLAARSLAEILLQRLYGATRLQDLSAREKAGDSPGSSSTPRFTTTAAALR